MTMQAEKLHEGVRELVFGTSHGKLSMPPTQEQRVLFIGDASGVVMSEVSPNRYGPVLDRKFLARGSLPEILGLIRTPMWALQRREYCTLVLDEVVWMAVAQ